MGVGARNLSSTLLHRATWRAWVCVKRVGTAWDDTSKGSENGMDEIGGGNIDGSRGEGGRIRRRSGRRNMCMRTSKSMRTITEMTINTACCNNLSEIV